MSNNKTKVSVTVSVPEELFQSIEEERKGLSRSNFISEVLAQSEKLKRTQNGVVYTPNNLAKYVAHKVLEYYCVTHPDIEEMQSLSVIDPACGDGELLVSIAHSPVLSQYSISPSQLKLFGVDIDDKALSQTKKRLKRICRFEGIITNALCPFELQRNRGWAKLKNKYNAGEGFDIAIANPPWGADVSNYSQLLHESSFSLLNRQYDTSDLFIETSLQNINEGGFIAFIVPDSLFYQERDALREFLLKSTTIHFIGRFGEKIFKDVNRACAVIICQKKKAASTHKIECFRLNSEQRRMILNGDTDFHSVEVNQAHKVEQKRFLKNKRYLFNIDIKSNLEKTYNKILEQKFTLSEFLHSSRGIELSKTGKVLQCRNCKKWMPLPKKQEFKCGHCKKTGTLELCERDIIVGKERELNCNKLTVGENISRYKITGDLWIDTSKEGINYKNPSLYSGEKILVRKTGIGISSSIDYSESMTNQVVYIFKLKPKIDELIPLEFFLAIINSRMSFFLTAMSNGEIEWKSHPYVTQKQVLDIPFPDVSKFSSIFISEIKIISYEIRERIKKNMVIDSTLDAKIENLVARAYQLNKKDYNSIYSALNSAQELLTIKALKSITIKDIFPE